MAMHQGNLISLLLPQCASHKFGKLLRTCLECAVEIIVQIFLRRRGLIGILSSGSSDAVLRLLVQLERVVSCGREI
ncbi:hypothetical protein K505DRAFT_136384 [Melanomma pulvis-pyrius CBS 109.77]|uniref:Uncharacterized protein n=1 Tax=Melanomma pulvis-pyrius CBS 109.77 TaxID=1314802 RepID=A0A6A6XM81_9PLEO|nr:hypothetical protein K505DRAFT_136384 [Melanomma pulvis-pyrius CBS 109.77]